VQLSLVFKHFYFSPPDMDWGILYAALTNLSHYLEVLEQQQNEESQDGPDQIAESRQSDEAIMVSL
jgi:hypothetical protein